MKEHVFNSQYTFFDVIRRPQKSIFYNVGQLEKEDTKNSSFSTLFNRTPTTAAALR